MDAIWYSPICDEVLARIYEWHRKYDRGSEAADRPQISLNGQIVKVVTKRAHTLAFKPQELDHLIRLMSAGGVNPALIEDFTRIRSGLKNGKLTPGGYRLVDLVFYKQDLEDILKALIRIKTGKLSIEEVAEKQKEAGKDLFEV